MNKRIATALALMSPYFYSKYKKGDKPNKASPTPNQLIPNSRFPDIGEVRGQESAKNALLIAAAGRHNLLMVGPPGEGKSFLASTIPGFLPPLSDYQQATQQLTYGALGHSPPLGRPFRAIGPTITAASLLGGGRGEPIPGEIALAHNGILFFDELPQFNKGLIDSLRQPLEDRRISVSRSGHTKVYQCDIQLIAAMNPCPCGYWSTMDDPESPMAFSRCNCTDYRRTQYQSKISGPILDRIDLCIWLNPLSSQERFSPAIPNQSVIFRTKVLQAQTAQLQRQRKLNYRLGAKEVFHSDNPLRFTPDALNYFQIETSNENPNRRYSTRKTVRLARIARTIADLTGNYGITIKDLHYAIEYTDSSLLSLGD